LGGRRRARAKGRKRKGEEKGERIEFTSTTEDKTKTG